MGEWHSSGGVAPFLRPGLSSTSVYGSRTRDSGRCGGHVADAGDAKALLAFDLPKLRAKNPAGFTIECRPQGQTPYYLHNSLRFEHPERHGQDASEPQTSSINAPLHKFAGCT
jgi:hypothetical protein